MMSNKQLSNNKSGIFTGTVKQIGIGRSMIGFVKALIGLAVVTAISIVLVQNGANIFIGVGLIAAVILVIIMQAVRLVRAANVSISGTETVKTPPSIDPDETLAAYIAGIWSYGAGTGSYSILGTGKNLRPANALLVTAKNLFLVTVPLTGAGVVASDTDISKWQWLTMQKEIEAKLKEMLEAMTLEELINNCLDYIQLANEDIVKVKTSDLSNGISLITRDGKKYSFSIRVPEDYQRAKSMMESLL